MRRQKTVRLYYLVFFDKTQHPNKYAVIEASNMAQAEIRMAELYGSISGLGSLKTACEFERKQYLRQGYTMLAYHKRGE